VPPSFSVGGGAQAITVTGSGFTPSSQVSWGGTILQTTFVSSTTLTATVPPSLTTTAGDVSVRVSDSSCSPASQTFCAPLTNEVVIEVGSSTRRHLANNNAADLVWDATHSLFYAAHPDIELGISAFDVDGVEVANDAASVHVSPAGRLAIDSQAQFLYLADSEAFISPILNRFTLPSLTNPASLPPLNAQQENEIDDIELLQGSQTIAFAGNRLVVVSDAGALRANQASVGLASVISLAWGFDGSTLYGSSLTQLGIFRFSVDASGVSAPSILGTTQFGSTSGVGTSRIYYDRTTRRLYGDQGQNLDEQGSDSRPFTLPDRGGCVAAVDGAIGKVFFACNEVFFDDPSGQSRLHMVVHSFDLATQLPIAQVFLPAAGGFPTRLIRWGTDGLALLTDVGLDLYSGPFVH
jgi:IPT/TIG domain